jgi:hypothetical protein
VNDTFTKSACRLLAQLSVAYVPLYYLFVYLVLFNAKKMIFSESQAILLHAKKKTPLQSEATEHQARSETVHLFAWSDWTTPLSNQVNELPCKATLEHNHMKELLCIRLHWFPCII